jgi:putative DNA primase/helicase
MTASINEPPQKIHPIKSHNSFEIGLEKGASLQPIKQDLIEFGCHYSDLHQKYVCPIEHKEAIVNLLNNNSINTTSLQNRHDLYFDKNENEKKVDRILGRAGFLREKLFSESNSIEETQKIRSEIEQLENQAKLLQIKNTDEQNKLDFIIKSLERNERGDCELFIYLYKDKYLFDSTENKQGEFYFWNGIHWQLDLDKQRYRDMEDVSQLYEWAADQVEDEKLIDKLLKRASALRTAKRCSAVFVFVSSETAFKGYWDESKGKLPCLNGVIDLRTGELLQPNPLDYIRKVCPTNYNPNADCPLFNKFLNDISLDREDIRSCIEDALGSALLGIPKEELVFYFYGEEGRNGKGTLLQTLERVLGSVAKTFPSEMLLLQRNPPSSSSPNPELANLQGVRLAIFSEINKGRKIDASKVKNLSGRDTIPCRRMYSGIDLAIQPTHTMFIQTNYKPEAPSDDNALWTRNVLIPFEAYFCDEPQQGTNQRKKDSELKNKLLEEKEGILNWLVNACINYQKHGLRIPESVRKATEDYRKENDGLGRFLEEMCVQDPVSSTQKSKMEKAIREFCDANGYKVPTRNDISSYLKAKFKEHRESDGRSWKGVKILEEKGLTK